MACGYESPIAGGVAWRHRGDDGERPVFCPGYTTKLPEVIETSRLRAHWKVGALALACHDRPPTTGTLDGILIVDWGHNAVDSWRMDEAARKRAK